MAVGVLFSLLLLVPGLTANLQLVIDDVELLSTCNKLSIQSNVNYGSFGRPQPQGLALGTSRFWRGPVLDKRQMGQGVPCGGYCGDGNKCCGVASHCCKQDDVCNATGCCDKGKYLCGDYCCPDGSLCPIDNTGKTPCRAAT